MQFNLSNFTTLKPKPAVGRQKSTVPLISFSKTGISFNSYIMRNTSIVKKYVQCKIDAASGKMAFIFSEDKMPDSYKVNIPKKGTMFSGTATVPAQSVLKWLNEETDLINTNIFHYRFKPEISESQSACMVELKDPYSKTKRTEKNKE
ncbi:hypothetical protein [Limosilactobacillus oris]|uniref:hypothetical protein n=1 Tax=Limosilactobacillus oris TaxID=1632 RepID=UPI00265B3AFD|nr:hypothetical protein [Limosilactobacillus oris]